MGQYWRPVNLDKKECLDPHKLATGFKLWEQLDSYVGTALIMLTAAMPYPRGGGDLSLETEAEHNVIGRWAGDRIALVGDYAEDSDLAEEHKASGIYNACNGGEYADITDDVCAVIEKVLDGKFMGDGWRRFVTKGEENQPRMKPDMIIGLGG